jgi:UDP-N-acetylglucosamine 4-epimerase
MACGDQVTLNEMIELLNKYSGTKLSAIYGPERIGDVKHSKADISKIRKMLSYEPTYRFKEGLEIALNWYKNNKNN